MGFSRFFNSNLHLEILNSFDFLLWLSLARSVVINLGNNVNQKLKDLGFNKISLEDYQIRDLKRLLSLPHGANFSVQGSGKTANT